MVRFPYVWGYREILPKMFFLNKATKVSKQLLPVYIAIAKSFQSKVVVQRKTWSTFQRLAVTPEDKFVQKWHRTRNETFPKVENIEKSFCRKVLTTKCSIFHWNSTIMASIAPRWVLVPRILLTLVFPRIPDLRVLFWEKSRNEIPVKCGSWFFVFREISENIKGNTRVCMGS